MQLFILNSMQLLIGKVQSVLALKINFQWVQVSVNRPNDVKNVFPVSCALDYKYRALAKPTVASWHLPRDITRQAVWSLVGKANRHQDAIFSFKFKSRARFLWNADYNFESCIRRKSTQVKIVICQFCACCHPFCCVHLIFFAQQNLLSSTKIRKESEDD